MEETAICVIDQDRKSLFEIKVATDPDATVKALKRYSPRLR